MSSNGSDVTQAAVGHAPTPATGRWLRMMIFVAVLGSLFGGLLVKPPSATAGGSGSDLGSNGQHRRPFYNFGHNPNELDEVSGDLAAGANALEPDVMRFSDATVVDDGRNVNAHAGPSGLFMYHDHFAVTTRLPTTVEAWLDAVRNKILAGSNVAMITFDIKSAAADESHGGLLLQAVRTHLNFGGVNVNVIFSVAGRGDGSVFNQIIPQLGPREGVMIDAENDPGAVYNYFVGRGAAGHIGYGNGAIGFRRGLAPNVLLGIERASWMRAGTVPALAIPYAYPMDTPSDMNALITAGADGLIPDFDSPVVTKGDTQDHIRTLAGIVNGRDDVFIATAADDPFHPRVEAYALQVATRDIHGAGTDSNITFTLTGCNGTSSVTVDTSFIGHMESGDTNYVTLQSKDLGSLQSLTLSSDGSRGGIFQTQAWSPGRVEISSANYGIPNAAHDGVDFSGDVDAGSPQTRNLGGWGHRCDPGIQATGAPFTATEGLPFSGQVASFADADPLATASEYAATINWTDGTASSAGTVTGPVNGTFRVNGTHTYAEEGSTIASVSILDTETGVIFMGSNPQATFSPVTIRDAPLSVGATPVIATEGAPFTMDVAAFSDADPVGRPSDYTASIDWGDGSTSTGTVSAGRTVFSVTGTHTYAEEGSFPVTTKVTDVGGATSSAPRAATVNDAQLTAAPVPVTATEGAPFTAGVATFTDADPAGTVSDYSATINWGDGSAPSAGTVSASGAGFAISGSHTYAEEGTFTVIAKAFDAGGATASAIGTATVADAALAATGRTVYTTNPVTNLDLASFTDADPAGTVSDYTATIDWGDGSTPSAGKVSGPDGGPFTVAGSHAYSPTGPFNIATKIHICDVGGSCADTTSLVKLLYMTGHSVALQTKLTIPLLINESKTVSDTGEVATTGATSTTQSVASISGLVRAQGINASVETVVGKSVAQSSVSQVTVNALFIPAIVIQGVSSISTTACAGSQGDSKITSLSIAGVRVVTAGAAPNTTINVGLVRVVLNEQKAVDGGLVVNAAHITIPGLLDLIVGSSRSDIHNCPPS